MTLESGFLQLFQLPNLDYHALVEVGVVPVHIWNAVHGLRGLLLLLLFDQLGSLLHLLLILYDLVVAFDEHLLVLRLLVLHLPVQPRGLTDLLIQSVDSVTPVLFSSDVVVDSVDSTQFRLQILVVMSILCHLPLHHTDLVFHFYDLLNPVVLVQLDPHVVDLLSDVLVLLGSFG